MPRNHAAGSTIARPLDARRWLVVSLVLLVLAAAVTAAATGLGDRTCLEIVNDLAPADRRSEVVSAFAIVCYIAISIPVIGVGVLARLAGAGPAAITFAPVVAVIAITALVIELELALARAES
ncbi:MAG TPA: hypothetical protein VGF94_30505 [Kofleriaceae bacterium]